MAEMAKFVPIKENSGILQMGQHAEAFLVLFLICEDLSFAFGGFKRV